MWVGKQALKHWLAHMRYVARAAACVNTVRVQMGGGKDDMGRKYLLYNMTKAAVLHGMKMEAADSALTSRHITVAAICPGWCRVSVRDVAQ